MTPQQFKNKVKHWLIANNIPVGDRKMRVFNTRRYGLEVRIYNAPMEFPNKKSSFRRTEAVKNDKGEITGWNGTRGIHSTKISTYTHINFEDFEQPDEMEFIKETLSIR